MLQSLQQDWDAEADSGIKIIGIEFDAEHYLAGFPAGSAPQDMLAHYVEHGWRQGRSPCSWFSPQHYLAAYPDVNIAGVNPFLHYLTYGRQEGRSPKPTLSASVALVSQQSFSSGPGPLWENFEPLAQQPDVKAIAYYLPQYHACPENDAFWGKGFTDWRNVSRALPRFSGHLQPRVPSDFGYYDLASGDVYRHQIDLARACGLHGFCFYYYAFGQRRVLERPTERLLAEPNLDFPFTLMWANESWTRTWGGANGEILIKQDYSDEHLAFITADLARHFRDPRYMRLDGRPLLFIYHSGDIPEPQAFFEKMRNRFRSCEGCDPLLYMAQTFGNWDPTVYGLDGAIQFPPHNLKDIAPINHHLNYFSDQSSSGLVFDYNEAIGLLNRNPQGDYPLIRCCAPHWDNEPRRPGEGMMLHNSTPAKFSRWVRMCADFARQNPIHGGERLIAVNAWNEWAEGAFLEPDMHYGHANLNALGRGLMAGRAR